MQESEGVPIMRLRRALYCMILLVCGGLTACKEPNPWEKGKKVVHYGLRAKVGSLDPVRSSTQYAGLAQAQVYEPILTYKYLVRPYELEPLLLTSMPKVSDDMLVYTFELKKGIYFHDDACFEATGGHGREVVAKDVIYSLMRMADRDLTPGGWWIYNDRIVGFNAFQERMNARPSGAPFDWDAPIEGLQVLDKYRFRITLVRPFPQFLYVLAMNYAAVVPRECAEYYGKEFGNHAIGTGPFILKSWIRGNRLVYERNPNYRDEYYPVEASEEFKERGLLAAAGKKIPFIDGLVFHIYEQDQPMWLKFRVGDIDLTQVPAEYFSSVFDQKLQLRPIFKKEGIGNYNVPLLDYIYHGFNMEDPVFGKGKRARLVRRAISLAFDVDEINDAFYNNTNICYDGPIPPGLDGYDPDLKAPYRGPDLERARALLAEAGYPGGEGLPPLQYEISQGGNTIEQAEMLVRQLKRIGIELTVNPNSFPELSEKLKRKKAQFFSLAWGADYPDAENFLQLFYGPNEAPGSNNFNYKNPEYDRIFEEARTMPPSPERTALYIKLRNILLDDVPAFGSMARTRFYVWNPGLKNVLPDEVSVNWFKYLDVEEVH